MMKQVKINDVKEVKLIIRNVNGMDLLFTDDGKLLANQGSGGHFYYIDVQGEPRYKTFRTAFFVDHDKVDTGESLKKK
jgi:hypothetical protein